MSFPRSQGAIRYANENGGGGGGPVTLVASGTGLTGGPITTTGTLNLANTAVTPGSYTLLNATVDQQGRLTAAANGTAVTSVTAGSGLTGGIITTTGTLALADTAVTPGTYTSSTITVDQKGRITAASSGGFGSVEGSIPLASFLAVPTTGYQLLAAPGAGKWIYVHQVALSFDYAGVPFANGEQINVRYTGGSTIMLNLMSAAQVQGIADPEMYWLANASGGHRWADSEDRAVSIAGNTGITDFTGGTNTTIKFHMTYTIYNL